MSKQFAEKIIDSMVDESGHCGERALSGKQFWIIADLLDKQEGKVMGGWDGHYRHIDFISTDYIGNIGKYRVVVNEYIHFNPRYTVKSIDLRDADEYQAEIDADAKLKALRDFSGSEWVAEPKKRIDMSLTLVGVYEYEAAKFSYYDSSTGYIYTLRDGDGNCIVWKTKNPLAMWVEDEDGNEEWVEAEIGDTIRMKATIKEHGEYRGTKQTVVARPKIAEIRKA